MDSKLLGGLIAVVAVAVVSLLLRRYLPSTPPSDTARTTSEIAETEEADAVADEAADEPADSEDDADELLAIESGGHVWLPDRHGIHRFALGEPGEFDPATLGAGGTVSREEFDAWRGARGSRLPRVLPGEGLHAGDFTAARIVRGAPDFDPWRLEALSRDGEYVAFAFETEEAARVAAGLLESRDVVRRPLDDDGTPIPASPGDFEEARRRWERTMEELAMSDDAPDEPR